MIIAVREARTETPLARGEEGSSALRYEGNWYFAPEAVESGRLRVTERTYTCPYKGTCHWVDFVGDDGAVAKDVAWVYAEPRPGHEAIRGRYGFYAGRRGDTIQTADG